MNETPKNTIPTPISTPRRDHKYLIRSNSKLQVDDNFITKVGSDELGDIYELDLSVDEYLKDEIFDILPKTNYTYAESAGYRSDVLDEGYISPNMSRRKLRNHRLYNPEDDGDDVIHNVSIGSNKRRSVSSIDRHKVLQENLTNSYIERRLEASYLERSGNLKSSYTDSKKVDYSSDEDEEIIVSSPKLSPSNRLRVRDDGMLLRSGHHLHSVKGMIDSHSDSASNIDMNINANTDRDRRNSYLGSKNRYDTEVVTTETTETTYSTSSSARTNPDVKQRLNYGDNQRDYADRVDYDETSYKYSSSPKSHKQTNSQQAALNSSSSINHMYGLDTDDEEGFEGSDLSVNSENEETIVDSFLLILSTIAAFFTDLFSNTIKTFGKIPSFFSSRQSTPSRQGSSFTPKSTSSKSSKSYTSRTVDEYSEYSRRKQRSKGACCLWWPCCCLFWIPLLLLLGLYNHDKIREITTTRFIPLIWSTEKNNTIIQQSSNFDLHHIDQRIQQMFLQLQGDNRRDMLSEKDINIIIQRLLESELSTLRLELDSLMRKAKDDQSIENQLYTSKLSSLEALLGAAQIKNKKLEDDIYEAKLNANLKTGELNDGMKLRIRELESELEAMKAQLLVLKDKESAMLASVKNCCDKDSYNITFIRQQIHDILAGMLAGGGKSSDSSDISNMFMTWLHGNYISKEEFEAKMVALAEDITEKVLALQREMKEQAVLLQSDRSSSHVGGGGLSEMHVRLLVEESLIKFSADRTGMADYALESAGGSLISIRCSETYYQKTALVSMFGIPLWYWSNSPRSVIQPNVNPGECWAFKGQRGQVVIELSNKIIPSGFTLEHIPKALSPTGDIKSAPKDFTVYGLEREDSLLGLSLGNYTYNDDSVPVQYFPIQIPNPPVFKFIELEVLNNYGQIKYTCLYRFRVHGTPVDIPK